MNFDLLKQKEDAVLTTGIRNDFTLRIHRIISWGAKAETTDDFDIKFICYWISFNAIYGSNFCIDISEKDAMLDFFVKISDLDENNELIPALMSLQNPIRILLNNNYVSKDFWEYYDNKISEEEFNLKHNRIKELTYKSLILKADATEILKYVFDLIYVLRNQIFHGSSTYAGRTNREQVKTSCYILETILPIITNIIFNNENASWNPPAYPVVEN